MPVLHLFDYYLPSTLSWVSRLLKHLPETEVWVGAPWIVQNQFYLPKFRYFTFPLQKSLFPAPETEWASPVWQKVLTRSQRFIPTYPAWLAHRLRTNPPALLHAHFGPTGCLYLPLAKQLNRPLFVTFYGFDYQKLLNNRPVFRQKYRGLFDGAARIIAASPMGCTALEALGCPAGKLAIVRPSPDLAVFPFVRRQKQTETLRLVQAATFSPKKGHITTLEAFRQALADCPGMHLTLAGEPYDRTVVRQVQAFIHRHQLQAHITCTGMIPHSNMPEFLARYDVFVHPSCTAPDGDHEATPVVLLEAQATGLPVLATRHFDLPDMVVHGSTGLLGPEGDAAALADSIRQFYHQDSYAYQEYSRQARAWVEAHFTVHRSAVQLQKLYRELG